MSNVKEIFINGEHSYNVSIEKVKNKTVYSLFFSAESFWTRPNELTLQLVDDGNGIKIDKLKTKNFLDYHEAEKLSVLLRVCSFLEGNKFEMITQKIEI